jgi:predicted  nucleic acid-binding Zn-ribbon protein
MRTRHRIPSIFNLSMVDVLCCALGCVILLWLLNLREAKQRAEQAGMTGEQLAAAVKERDQLYQDLRAAQAHAGDLERSLRSRQGQLEDTAAQLLAVRDRLRGVEEKLRDTAGALARTQAERDAAQKQMAELGKDLVALRGQKADAEALLARRAQEHTDLEKKRADADKRVADLEGQVRAKDALLAAGARKAEGLQGKLNDAEARAGKLQALADQLPNLRKDANSFREQAESAGRRVRQLEQDMTQKIKELAEVGANLHGLQSARAALEKDLAAARDRGQALEARLKDLARDVEGRQQDLADAGQRLLALGKEKKALEAEAVRLRAAADNRFAGITLTGKRVLFLVDMSGSMDLVDENTPAPKKWPGVRETVAKVMKSLPDLEKFQVLLFAEKVTYLLGGEGRWLDFDPKMSPETVFDALARTKPEGGTNMYIAMQAAFGYRAKGLDTIYLLSDGLPNIGEGLPPNARDLKEMERCEYLSKHIRKTLKASWNRPADGWPRVRINAVGFFYESPDVGAFLWALARENDGSFVGMSQP